jgi:hypothetical protein
MKRTILLLCIGALLGGGGVWLTKREGKPAAAAEAPAAPEEEGTSVKHDKDGNVILLMSDEMQGDAGIVVTNPVASQLFPETKGYGHVVDPTPLTALLGEMATAQAAYAASSNELARQKILTEQGNSSARALQSAEAAALRDELAIQSAKDRLALAWGDSVAGQKDLPAFVKSLAARDALLVRIDLPAGEVLQSTPASARIVNLSGDSADAEFLGAAASADLQTQGRGLIFIIRSGGSHLLPGEAVTGFLKLPGEPVSGVIVPRNAVVRTEGKGWVYILNGDSAGFTRKEIPLTQPTASGWFVAEAVKAGQFVVVVGAQQLLSEELKASIQAD